MDKMGIQILTTKTFGWKESDFSAQLTKIKSLNPDAIVVSALVEPASGILLGARAVGIDPKVRFIGGNGFKFPQLRGIARGAGRGPPGRRPRFLAHDGAPHPKILPRPPPTDQ